MDHSNNSLALAQSLEENLQTFLGYPCNTAYDYSEILPYFKYNINNVGCPFTEGTYKVNTKHVEQEVLAFFANLWGINPENIWGYVTSAGTEGNMQGLYVGREALRVNEDCEECVFYTSKESHYSLFKIARILQLDLCVINTQPNGEMDYMDFEQKLCSNLTKSALINANLGTTMKGAIDNTAVIHSILSKHKKQSRDFYIHADGALMGFLIPFIENDLIFKQYINSISISGHKFLGIKFPCGVFLMENKFLSLIKQDIEYIGSSDCTISGSRNGHTPLFFKHIITNKGVKGFKEDIDRCIALAEYLVQRIPSAWKNPSSITVVFPRPSDQLICKWQLATQGDISHVVVMPHVTKEKLDAFISDYISH